MDQYFRLNTVATGGWDMKFGEALENFTHCQRNFDLDFVIPDEDIATLMRAVDLAPCKSNVVYYDVFFITKRDFIETILSNSWTHDMSRRNGQVMANLLVAFIPYLKNGEEKHSPGVKTHFEDYSQMMMGIATTTMGIQANLMGYRTGFCGCVDHRVLIETLSRETGREFTYVRRCMLMGIGKPMIDKPYNWDPYSEKIIGRSKKLEAKDYIYRIV
jgi:nitroreductase